MTRERMSGVDTAWLRMDSPGNLMMIVGVEIFSEPLAYADLCRIVEQRLLKFDRFRQKVESDATGYWWVEDPGFRLRRHVVRIRLRGRAGDGQLQALAAKLASEPLDPAHPLWQFHLVERYEGGSAVIIRIHHCIADGIALVGVTLSLSDGGGQPQAHAGGGAGRRESEGEPEHEAHDLLAQLGSLLEPVANAAVAAAGTAGETLARSFEFAGGLATDGQARSALSAIGTRVATDALKIALMPDDSPTRLKGKPSGRKAVAWNAPMPLDEVKAVCKVLGVSVNDVLLSCVAGALQRYLEAHGEFTAGKEIRAMVPVNLRRPDEPLSLGNRFGLVPLTLPIGLANPVERLFDVRRRMAELKGGYQGPLAYGLLSAIGHAPRQLQSMVLEYLAHKGTAVMTNVPGPRSAIEIFGRKLARAMFWVPQAGDIGVGVSILSYDGSVQFGLITDVAVCSDPQRIVDGFEPEFDRLVMTLSMLPRELVHRGLADVGEIEHRLFGRPAGAARKARSARGPRKASRAGASPAARGSRSAADAGS